MNKVLALGVSREASDVHVDPTDDKLRIRFRVDGQLRIFMEPPMEVAPAIVSRLKIMASLDIAETRLPQAGPVRASPHATWGPHTLPERHRGGTR